MRRAKIIQFFFLLPLVSASQTNIKPLYGFALNNSIEHVISNAPELQTSNARAIGFYYTLGLQKQIDSVLVFQTSLRFGREKSSFEVYKNGMLVKDFYYFSNRSLMFLLSPGLILNKHQRLFLMLGIGRFFQSDEGGGGVTENFGERTYTYAIHLNRNAVDYRLGLKWQIRPMLKKKLIFEIGVEASQMEHRGLIQLSSPYNNQPPELYELNYSTLLLHIGFNFN